MGIRNRPWLRHLLLLFVVLHFLIGAETSFPQDKQDVIKALLKERRDLLNDVATAMTKAYFERKVGWEVLVQAERESLRADLDWFDRPEERIQAIEKHKKLADKILAITDAAEKVGKLARTDVLQVRAYVLEIQIELLKEQRKTRPAK